MNRIKKLENKIEKFFKHPITNVILMGIALVAINNELIMFDEWYDFLWLLIFISVFLMSLNDFINWKLKKTFQTKGDSKN